MKKKKRTNNPSDKLARMVQNGFESVGKDITELRQEMRGKFAEVDRNFQIVNHKIDTLTRRVDAMVDYNRRIARLERLIDSIMK